MIYSENVLICIVIPILITMVYVKGESRRYAQFFVIGMVACLLSAYISGYIDHVTNMGENWTSIYVSPIVEEMMKLLPLLFYMMLSEPDEDKIFTSGVAAAAGFATFENCCYILTAGAESLSFILVRGMAVGIMHVVSIMALCLGLVLVKRIGSFSMAGIIGALSFSMTFHSLYNLLVSEPGLSTAVGYGLPVIAAAALYFPYKRIVK